MPNCAHDVLSKTVLRVDTAEPLSHKRVEIRHKRASHVAVFAQGQCLGVSNFHDADLSSDDIAYEDFVASVDVSQEISVEELGRVFADSNVEAQVVRNDQGEFVGVVTRQSLLEALLRERTPNQQALQLADMTKHKQAESLLAGEKRLLEIISTSSSHDGGLTELVRFVETQSDEVICSILLMDDQGTHLRNGAAISLPESFLDAIDGIEIGQHAGPCGTAAFLNQGVIVSDIANDPLCTNFRDLALSHGLCACWCTPIHSSSGAVLGTITLYYNHPRTPSASDKTLIERAIHLAAIAIERKRSKDALTRSDQKLRRAQQIAHVGSFELAADATPTYWSDECYRIIGLEPGSKMPSRKHFIEKIIHPDDLELSQQTVQHSLKQCEGFSYEYRVTRPDGSIRWVHSRGEPVCDQTGTIQSMEGTLLDITKRKQTEDRLRASETRSRAMLEGSPVCTKIIDLDSRLQYMSAAGQKQLKISDIESFYGSVFPPQLYPESWRGPVSEYLERAKAGEICSLECPVLDTEGTEVWFDTTFVPALDEDGRIQYVIVTSVNITERKRGEDALRASEIRSRTMLEGSPVCTKIIDLNSRLQYMSAAGQKQLKISNVELYYGSEFPPELYPESWRAPVTEHLQRAMAGEICSLECPVLDTEGAEVWFDTTFVPARDQDGRIQHIIVTSVNITERKQAEEDSRKHRDELAHVSRASTMGEMATGVAHELNQPLGAIASYSHTARIVAEQFPSYELQEILGKLEDQAIRAGDIVRRLRNFVRKTESERERIDLNSLVRDVAKFVEPDIHQADMRLTLKFDESSPGLLVDVIQIQQVLVNLIRNSIDAMQDTPTDQRELTVSVRMRHDGQAEVVVRDAGKGLDQDELDQVFNAFFSTKQDGMGMGLPISRSIVEAHGGKLWAKPNNGPGISFGFTIPRNDGDEPDRSPTVFIVDDEDVMRDSLRLLVQTMGLSAKCFSSAIDFLEFIEPYESSCPVCLIADVRMPQMSGVELVEQLRSLDKQFPIILTSGHGTIALKHKAREFGAAFLEKPFRPADLRAIIETSLERTIGQVAANGSP